MGLMKDDSMESVAGFKTGQSRKQPFPLFRFLFLSTLRCLNHLIDFNERFTHYKRVHLKINLEHFAPDTPRAQQISC